ncbi:MAG: hypothetical protein JNJ69_03015 [Leptospiraceae bacterium]|nr:hypothetical protein [Leptospiraceae bacterium]
MIQTTKFSEHLKERLGQAAPGHDPVSATYSIRAPWPGVQLYYPPVKYLPREERYESKIEAADRLRKYAAANEAHTVIFDLEDGCRQKAMSRAFLAEMLPTIRAAIPGRVAIRINPMGSAENHLDLRLITEIGSCIDDVMLAKATENYGIDELHELGNHLSRSAKTLRIQPIIEHPRSLRNAPAIFACDAVEHVVFGIHDFSRALHLQISPEHWIDELYPYMCELTLEARIAGKGVIGGVETLLLDREPPEKNLLPEWLSGHACDNARIIYEHARREALMGYTGKQVIHPNHIRLIRYAFQPHNEDLHRSLRILQEAVKANAFLGGAVRFEDEMMDPPMFAKALQTILRAIMLGFRDKNLAAICEEIIAGLPEDKLPEIWPYPVR